MTGWVYTGRSSVGKEIEGEINAANKDEAKALLRKKRILVTKINRKPIEINIKLSKGVSVKDIARFTRQFSAMNASGLPLIQCLETLGEQVENKNLKEAVKKISVDIQGGGTLADSFSKHPKVFSELYCYMLGAGEAGGILDSILARLAEYLENTDKLIRKIRGAMIYPSFIMVVSVAAILVMLKLVVPTFAQMFASTGKELPAPTKLVLGLSEFVQDYLIVIFIVLAAIPFFVYRYYKTEKGKYQIDRLLLVMPALGSLFRRSSIARFSQTLSTLLNAGIPIIDGLRITSKTAGNSVLERGIIKALDSISGGQTIAEPLKETRIFPPMVIQMISVGEKTGGLSEMLERVAVFYEDEVNAAVDSLTSLIEPLIIVFLGGIIAVVLIAMYLPMFSMTM